MGDTFSPLCRQLALPIDNVTPFQDLYKYKNRLPGLAKPTSMRSVSRREKAYWSERKGLCGVALRAYGLKALVAPSGQELYMPKGAPKGQGYALYMPKGVVAPKGPFRQKSERKPKGQELYMPFGAPLGHERIRGHVLLPQRGKRCVVISFQPSGHILSYALFSHVVPFGHLLRPTTWENRRGERILHL